MTGLQARDAGMRECEPRLVALEVQLSSCQDLLAHAVRAVQAEERGRATVRERNRLAQAACLGAEARFVTIAHTYSLSLSHTHTHM